MNVYTFCLIISVFFLMLTVFFLKKRLLEFKYGIFWLVISLIMIMLSLNINATETLVKKIMIAYTPSFLLLVGTMFILLMMLHLTIIICDIHKKMIRLSQEIGILKKENKTDIEIDI